MIRVILAWAIITAGLWFTIQAFREMTGKEKWDFLKTLFYSAVLSGSALLIIIGIVVLF